MWRTTPIIKPIDVAHDANHQTDCKIRHRSGVDPDTDRHWNAALFRRDQIDILVAGREATNDPQARQTIHQRRGRAG